MPRLNDIRFTWTTLTDTQDQQDMIHMQNATKFTGPTPQDAQSQQ